MGKIILKIIKSLTTNYNLINIEIMLKVYIEQWFKYNSINLAMNINTSQLFQY